MQWSDVTRRPSSRILRQFSVLWLLVFGAFAALRWFGGRPDAWAVALGVAAVGVGLAGLAVPTLVRPIFVGWMIAAFPIGWTVSRVVLATIYFVVITPIAGVFRLMGRDVLRLRRHRLETYWVTKPRPASPAEYLRQS
jgi:hypothetical protein